MFVYNFNKYYHKYIDIAVTSQSSVASELNKKNSSKKYKHEFVKKNIISKNNMVILAPSIPHVREKKFRGKIKTRIKRRAKSSVGFIPLFDCTKKKLF